MYCMIQRGFSMKLSKMLHTHWWYVWPPKWPLWFLINCYIGMHDVFTCSLFFFTNRMSMEYFSSCPFSYLHNECFLLIQHSNCQILKKCWKLVCDKSRDIYIRYLIKSEMCLEEKCLHRHACNNTCLFSQLKLDSNLRL